MSSQAIQAGEAFVKLNVHGDEVQKSLINIGSQIDDFGSKTTSFLSTLRSALGGAINDGKQLGDSFSIIGKSLKIFGTGYPYITQLSTWMEKAALASRLFTFQIIQNSIANKMNTVLGQQNIVTQTAATIASYAGATAVKTLGAAQWLLNTAMFGCPLTWFIAGLAAVGGAVTGVMWLFGAFKDNVAENAKALEELCKRHDSYRDSAKKSIGILEEYSNKTSLSSEHLNASKDAYHELERKAKELGITLKDNAVIFDEEKGKILVNTEAMKDFKKKMRAKEIEELNKTIQAQEEHLDDLSRKLKDAKTWSWRSFGTYVTFGYVDNAEEIQKQIDEESQKFQENQEKRKVVVDFSAEYKENEAKLQEMYDKEAEASKNALAVKIDNIKTEFSEREAILKQLIDEAEVRDSLSFEDMEKLRERRAALAGLNAEQEKRIQLLRDEQAEKYPLQDVTALLGNSPAVAQKHYLQVKSTNFQLASETETVGHFIGHKKGQHCNAEACRNMNENEEVPCFTTQNSLLNINLHESACPTESPSSVISAS
ncbi:MAG: hypothetical protein Q4A17_04880 [Thermoguttaceae bacterium]|nr:hypothetical protein [Thermoguttaceae bacterium]